MKRALALGLLLLASCASSKGAGDAEPAAAAPSSSSGGSDECTLARTAAESAWARQFGRVQELSPEDRAEMARQHASATDAELARLAEEATAGGDDIMLEAVRVSQAANETCR